MKVSLKLVSEQHYDKDEPTEIPIDNRHGWQVWIRMSMKDNTIPVKGKWVSLDLRVGSGMVSTNSLNESYWEQDAIY